MPGGEVLLLEPSAVKSGGCAQDPKALGPVLLLLD